MTALVTMALMCGVAAAAGADGPPQADATFRIQEHSPRGTLVGTVPHDGRPARFELAPGSATGVFAVDAATGRITVESAEALDYERRSEYLLTVRVTLARPEPEPEQDRLWQSFTDRLGGEFGPEPAPRERRETTVERFVRIRLIDVNEPPLVADQTFAVAEWDGSGTLVGTVAASDPDHNDRLNFTILEGDEAGAFRIDRDSGRLTVDPGRLGQAGHSDRQTATLRVQVTDAGGLSSTARVTVTLPPRSAEPDAPIVHDGPIEAPRPSGLVQVLVRRQYVSAGEPSTAAARTAPPTPSESSRAAAPPWWQFWRPAPGLSPLAAALAALLGFGAHVLRMRAAEQRLAALSQKAAALRKELAAAAGRAAALPDEIVEARQKLDEERAKLAEDQAQLIDDQRQLEARRGELAARQDELRATEALLTEQRAELEDERRRLRSEWTRHSLGAPSARPGEAGSREDLYAVDPEAAEGDDPELTALRANLADMFGMAAEGSSEPGGVEPEAAVGLDVVENEPLTPEWRNPSGARDSLYQRRAVPAAAPPTEEEGDPISTYMDALLKRLRQNSGGGSPGISSTAETGPGTSAARTAKEGAAATAIAALAAGSAEAVAESTAAAERDPAPRPRPDKAVVKETVDSLREVANLSARSAVASYIRRRRKRRGMLVGLSYVALLALAAALLAGLVGGPISHAAFPWLLVGTGAVVFVHYCWTVTHADRHRRNSLDLLARNRRKAQAEAAQAATPEPAAGNTDAAPGVTPAARE